MIYKSENDMKFWSSTQLKYQIYPKGTIILASKESFRTALDKIEQCEMDLILHTAITAC